jgi:hypothetical protein
VSRSRPQRPRTSGPRAGWLALVACLVAGAPAGAAAETAAAAPAAGETPRVAILALSLRGIAADQERRYHEILRTELKRAGYEVIDEREARKQLERQGAPPNCTVGPCLQRVGGALRAQRVLVGGVLAQGSNYDVNLTFLDTSQGAPVAQASERCEVCTADEGLRAFGRVIGSLTGRAPSSGASGPPPPPVVWHAAAPWYQQPGWRISGLSLGVAALAVGATLLAVDGSCTGGKSCPRTLEFTIPGATLIGVGALFVTAAVLTYLIKSPPRPAPRLAFGAGPTGVLLCGRY